MSDSVFTKWVTCWGNATSITDRKEAVYAKDITLRYPIRMCFSGSKIRLRMSNLTGTEDVTITKTVVAKTTGDSVVAKADYVPVKVTFGGKESVTIAPGCEVESDELAMEIVAGETLYVSMYLGGYTQMNAGTLITGPLSGGKYSYGDYAESAELPLDLTRKTNWHYFLNTVDVLTEEGNRCVVCYGDSITAQSWPDYMALELWERGIRDVAVIRRAVSGTRILRQYNCITYQAYGLKGETRFPIEMNVSGASDVIIQHGINDIIHPVGVDVNPFRPWSDMPTVGELCEGVEKFYLPLSRRMGLRVWSGTLLPINGWRTYNADREKMREEFNSWLRTSELFDGCIDFDRAICDTADPTSFAAGFDSGDHLHPSESAYKSMAHCAIDSMAAVF